VPDHSARRYHTLVLRARLQRRQGDAAGANASLALAIAIAPSRPEALVELGWACLDNGQTEHGLEFARRARSLTSAHDSPTHIAAWAHVLSLLAASAGDREETAAALAQLEHASPDASYTAEARARALSLLQEHAP